MSDPADLLTDALRPIVAALVAEQLEQRLPERESGDEPPPFLTVAQYAERHQATADAVRARCRRGRLPGAFKPPGSRDWLIPTAPTVDD